MKKENNAEISIKDNVITEKKPPVNEVVKVTKVGALLKEMRLQKGLKIAEISKILCIRKHYIEAIEDSDYKEIPAFPYGIGFIRSYASFLGLNGENIVDLYKEETQDNSNKDTKELETQKDAVMPELRYLLLSILAIVLIYIVWVLFNSKEETAVENFAEQNNVVMNGDAVVIEDLNINSDVADADVGIAISNDGKAETQIVVSEGVYNEGKDIITEEVEKISNTNDEKKAENIIPQKGIYVEVLKDTWVEVKDENKLYLSKVLKTGDKYMVPEGKGKIFSVGKYDGVNVYIDGVLTNIVKPNKKTNISLDKFLNSAQ